MAKSLQRIPTAVVENYPVAEGLGGQTKPNGVAAAAILAASIGACVLGISIVVTEAIPAWMSAAAQVYMPAGPISGRSTLAVLAYVVALGGLIRLWHARNVNFGRVWTVSLVLLALGLLGSFPLFYGLFAPQ